MADILRLYFLAGALAMLLMIAPTAATQPGSSVPLRIDTDAALGVLFRDKDDLLTLLQAFGSPERLNP